jgi:anti-sigma factor RsiW
MSLNFCNAYEEILILVASGAATAEEANRARAHLDGCGTCRSELERLRRMISVIEQASSPISRSAAPESLHARLMTHLRAETVGLPKRTTVPLWLEPLRSWRLSRQVVWGMAALSVVTVGILFTVWRFSVGQSVIHSGKLGAALDSNSPRLPSSGSEAAGPAELRLALSRSFEDFEMALRLNDQVFAMREPMVVPSKSRSVELR